MPSSPEQVNHSGDVLVRPPTEYLLLEDLHDVRVVAEPHRGQRAWVDPEDLAIALSELGGPDSGISVIE